MVACSLHVASLMHPAVRPREHIMHTISRCRRLPGFTAPLSTRSRAGTSHDFLQKSIGKDITPPPPPTAPTMPHVRLQSPQGLASGLQPTHIYDLPSIPHTKAMQPGGGGVEKHRLVGGAVPPVGLLLYRCHATSTTNPVLPPARRNGHQGENKQHAFTKSIQQGTTPLTQRRGTDACQVLRSSASASLVSCLLPLAFYNFSKQQHPSVHALACTP
jgi:hypothetical protein